MRLLYADDEEEMVAAVSAILKKNNYSVDAVNNGTDALDYLKTGLYDLAILDIMMPGLDGVSVVTRARTEGIDTPVLLLTAKSEVDDRVAGLDAGADDYLTKPFAMKELLARVRALSRRQSEVTSSELKLGNLTLDRLTYQISTPTGSIRLGNKDFQMLEMLMVNPGQVISVDQFMDKIWGYDSDAELNIVWVYISNLRKKLNGLESTVNIKATRGVGYSMEELS